MSRLKNFRSFITEDAVYLALFLFALASSFLPTGSLLDRFVVIVGMALALGLAARGIYVIRTSRKRFGETSVGIGIPLVFAGLIPDSPDWLVAGLITIGVMVTVAEFGALLLRRRRLNRLHAGS